jgi:glycerophosphoryl diester phosphodiesterase
MTLVIAHRGASRAERENTLAAFRAARRLGAGMVELDVRLLADGALAVHHDVHLPDGRRLPDLVRGDLPEHVPLLDEALAACEGMDVNVEIKNSATDPSYDPSAVVADRVAEVVNAAGVGGRVLVSSFDLATADRAKATGLASAWLVVAVPDDGIETLLAHGLVALHPWHEFVTEDLVRRCHEHGLRVNAWTVDDPDRMRELAGWGVDGICTNVPDIAVAALTR